MPTGSDARYVATGHYARVEHRDDGPHLFRSAHAKDQAYALAQLAPAQLERLLLPLGELDKAQTREHARRLGFRCTTKPSRKISASSKAATIATSLARLHPQTHAPARSLPTTGERVGDARRDRELHGRPARAASRAATTARATSRASTPRPIRSSSDAKTSCFRSDSSPAKST